MNKIAVFIPSLEYGGAERVTSYIVNHLCNKYEVILFTSKSATEKEYPINEKIQRYVLNSRIELKNKLIEFEPDICIIMFAPMGIKLVPTLRKLRIPFIISERNDPQHFAGKKITKYLYQYYMKYADGVVFQTHDVVNYYKPKLKNVFCKVIYNPIDFTNFPHKNKSREKKIVNVGRLHPQKNQKLLIEAFSRISKKYPDYTLEIYGEGELRNFLQTQINDLGMNDKIFLKGSTKNVLKYVNNCEIFVLSSDFEGLPNSLLEAMALGMPVISTDCPCGGPKEMIKTGVNGILVPVKNIDKLSSNMELLISNKKIREDLSVNAEKIRYILDSDKILQQWENFCIEVLRRRNE